MEECRLIVSMKQFDSIFHSIKLAIRTGAVWLSALTHFQIPLLIERVYVLVSGKLEKFITWKMLYFSPSRLCTACPPLNPSLFLNFITVMSSYEINLLVYNRRCSLECHVCVCVCVIKLLDSILQLNRHQNGGLDSTIITGSFFLSI